ncbi:MAG: hypothetical protein II837_08565 [Treponema sp.]|nr:hypothetical protein [Treponema sp.]
MEDTRTYGYKPIDQLVFSDDFMFGAVMSDSKICKSVLELLLQVKIDHVEYPELQKSMNPFYRQKGVRLDVYVADSDRVFDVEVSPTRPRASGSGLATTSPCSTSEALRGERATPSLRRAMSSSSA